MNQASPTRPRTATLLHTAEVIAARLLLALMLRRLFKRLEELFALWRAGKLPAPLPPAPRARSTPRRPAARPARPSHARRRTAAPRRARQARPRAPVPTARPRTHAISRTQGAAWHPSIPQWPPRRA